MSADDHLVYLNHGDAMGNPLPRKQSPSQSPRLVNRGRVRGAARRHDYEGALQMPLVSESSRPRSPKSKFIPVHATFLVNPLCKTLPTCRTITRKIKMAEAETSRLDM